MKIELKHGCGIEADDDLKNWQLLENRPDLKRPAVIGYYAHLTEAVKVAADRFDAASGGDVDALAKLDARIEEMGRALRPGGDDQISLGHGFVIDAQDRANLNWILIQAGKARAIVGYFPNAAFAFARAVRLATMTAPGTIKLADLPARLGKLAEEVAGPRKVSPTPPQERSLAAR